MTAPLAAASTNVYTVAFDGFAVTVAAAKRGKVLRTIPVAELVAVEFKPARGVAGGSLRFRVTGKASPRDVIYFRDGQQPGMERLAATIQRYAPARHQPWPDTMPTAVDPWPPAEQVVVTRTVADPAVSRGLVRALTWAVRLEFVSLVLVLAPLVIAAGVASWLLLR